nr:hypothetical protein [Tanacetum cinerariifolium]
MPYHTKSQVRPIRAGKPQGMDLSTFMKYRPNTPRLHRILKIHRSKPKPFKFYSLVTRNEKFRDTVMNGWSEQGNLHENVKQLRNKLDTVQARLDDDHFNVDIRDEEASTVAAFNEALLLQECRIDVITSSNGTMFHNEHEIKNAMFSMDNEKAPGPDGYTTAFFKEAWDIVEDDIVEAVREFFTNGKRGLHQGDPLFPYLFTLVMEILTLIIKRRVRDTDLFVYHRYCLKLELVNLCFTNDLFLFAHGDVDSVKVIKEALEEFKNASGLILSLPKSTAYFCNVLNHVNLSILHILPFEEGRLPVKYIGVPLVSSRLMFRDCKELIEKVESRIIRGFLWCQGNMKKGRTNVAWEVVCLPKDEGGLGLRIPRHAFNLWLIMKEILKTQDRVCSWDVSASLSTQCPLCDLQPDSHKHLFFECPFSQQVWNHMKCFANLDGTRPELDHIMSIIKPFAKRRSSKNVIAKLVLAACAYFIWQERNARLFRSQRRSVLQVIEGVIVFSGSNLFRADLRDQEMEREVGTRGIGSRSTWNVEGSVLVLF